MKPEGFLFAAISVLAFGSNFVVTKKYKTGDVRAAARAGAPATRRARPNDKTPLT